MNGLLAVRLKGDVTRPVWIVHIQEGEQQNPMCGKRELDQYGIDWQAPLTKMPFAVVPNEYAYGLCPLCAGVLLSRLWERMGSLCQQ